MMTKRRSVADKQTKRTPNRYTGTVVLKVALSFFLSSGSSCPSSSPSSSSSSSSRSSSSCFLPSSSFYFDSFRQGLLRARQQCSVLPDAHRPYEAAPQLLLPGRQHLRHGRLHAHQEVRACQSFFFSSSSSSLLFLLKTRQRLLYFRQCVPVRPEPGPELQCQLCVRARTAAVERSRAPQRGGYRRLGLDRLDPAAGRVVQYNLQR